MNELDLSEREQKGWREADGERVVEWSGLEQRAARAGPERPRSGAYVSHLNVVGLRWDGVRHKSSNLVSPPKAQPGCRGDYVTCPLTGRSFLELYGRDGGG